MKRKNVIAILFAFVVFAASCGQKEAQNTVEKNTEAASEIAEDTESAEPEEINTEEMNTENEQPVEENTTESTLSSEQINAADKIEVEVDTESSVSESEKMGEGGFKVQIEENKESYKVVGKEEIMWNIQSYPKISSGGKTAETINADIESIKASMKNETDENLTAAKEDYLYRIEQNPDAAETTGVMIPFEMQETSVVTRNDAAIFSFAVDSYAFLGGAHGCGATTGYNYDAKTGKHMQLEDLSEDSEAFKANVLSFVKEQCESDAYRERLFEDYETYLEETVFAEDSWYFTDSGILISCPPYTLSAYVEGTINFEIPYETLKTFGMKAEYLN